MVTARARMALVLVAAAAVAGSARAADDRESAREHYARGTKAFDLGQYDEAITEYSAAYKAKDAPEILYNIAQAHRLAGHSAEALRFYRIYLTKLPAAANRAEVERKIEELQKLVDQQRKTQNMPPDQPLRAPAPETAPATGTPPAPPAPAAAVAAPAAAPAPGAGRTKKIVGLVVGGVGVGALAVGIGMGVLAKNAGDELSRNDAALMAFDASKERAGQTYQALEGVFLAVGGVAVASGVVLYVLGHREAHGGRR